MSYGSLVARNSLSKILACQVSYVQINLEGLKYKDNDYKTNFKNHLLTFSDNILKVCTNFGPVVLGFVGVGKG